MGTHHPDYLSLRYVGICLVAPFAEALYIADFGSSATARCVAGSCTDPCFGQHQPTTGGDATANFEQIASGAGNSGAGSLSQRYRSCVDGRLGRTASAHDYHYPDSAHGGDESAESSRIYH